MTVYLSRHSLKHILWEMLSEFKFHGHKQSILVPQSRVELMIVCMFPLLISNKFIAINPFSLKRFP